VIQFEERMRGAAEQCAHSMLRNGSCLQRGPGPLMRVWIPSKTMPGSTKTPADLHTAQASVRLKLPPGWWRRSQRTALRLRHQRWTS